MDNYLVKNLKFLRKDKGMSQQKLAEELGFSRSNIAAYERGNSEPNVQKLLTISNFFNINLSDFLSKDLAEVRANDLLDSNSDEKGLSFENTPHLAALEYKVKGVDKMLASIREFHQFRLPQYKERSNEFKGLISNFENLLDLCDYLLEENKTFLKDVKNDINT